jgi:hypothetical protein
MMELADKDVKTTIINVSYAQKCRRKHEDNKE